MKPRLIQRAPTVPLEVHLRTIASKNRERDAAYQAGHADGWILGYEAGLRAQLDEARLALGEVA